MKKVVVSLVFAGILLGSAPLDAAVSKMRAVKCAIPRLHAKFNCTDEEKAVGRKWLKGATIAAAVAALAALVVGGVKLAEVQAEKKRLAEQESRRSLAAQREKKASQEKEQAAQLAKKAANPELIHKEDLKDLIKIDLSAIPDLDIEKLLKNVRERFADEQLIKDIVNNYLKSSSNAVRKLRDRVDAIFATKGLPQDIYYIALQRGKLADPPTSSLQEEYRKIREAMISKAYFKQARQTDKDIGEQMEKELARAQKQLKKLQRAAAAEGTSDSGQEGSSSPGDVRAAQVLIANYKRRVSPLAQELVDLVQVFEISNYDEQMFSRLLSAHPAKLQEIKAMIERMSIEQSLKQKMLAGIEAKTKIPQKQKEKVRAYA